MIRKRHYRRTLQCEPLERRELLHGGRITWAELPQLTLSFAPDAVDVAGEPNMLASDMTARFGNAEWKETILRAFQTWAAHTNANIGVVEEVGSNSFGTPGARTGDSRFGEIRIGARPLTNDVLAVSVSQNTLVSGTWAGDVIFNSDGEYDSLDDLFSIALHEAGHVFGLSHSENPDSPMYVHGVSSAIKPLPEDIADLTALYGDRHRDAFEGQGGNDRLIAATSVSLNSRMRESSGSAPSIVFADLTHNRDLDYYRIAAPPHYSGPVSILLRSDGISLVKPTLTVMDDRGVTAFSSNRVSEDGVIVFHADSIRRGLFVKVESNRDDVFAIGAYSLVVNFDGLSQVDAATIDQLSGRQFRQLEGDDIDSFFRSGDRRLFRDDDHSDDRPESARNFDRIRYSEELVSLRTVGSISDSADVDNYRFTSPGELFATGSTTYVSVRSLQSGTLVPRVTILNDQNESVEYQVLANGNGELLVQIVDVENERMFKVAVSSAGQLPAFQQGNYELNVFFTKTPIEFETFAAGTVDANSASTHRLHVAAPQLFQFALNVDGDDSRSGLLVRLLDADSQVVGSIVSPRGQTRTSGGSLLLPGTYTLQVIPLILPGAKIDTMNFSLSGTVISDPFGIDPVLPDDTEFDCPGLDDVFCYPDNVSTLPFDWDEFVTFLEDLNIDAAQVNDALLGDWWSAYWQTTSDGAAPISVGDDYTTEIGQTLAVAATEGVLANDVSETGTIIATVVRSPQHGELLMEYNGGFSYTPSVDFTGIDSFQYVVSDFRHTSEWTTASIAVGIEFSAGDVNRDGTVDVSDINALSAAIRTGSSDSSFDLNSDGAVDSQDHRFLIHDLLGTFPGDANLDGRFDSADLVLVFQTGHYEDETASNSGWRHGDWNGDGEFNSADLVAAFQVGGYTEDENS